MWGGLVTTQDPGHPKLVCERWENVTSLIVQRDGFANFYHSSEDWVNAWLAMAILNLSVSETQVFLTDLHPWGPFKDMWTSVFGWKHPVLNAWDLQSKYAGQRVCFRRAIISIFGPASPFTFISAGLPPGTSALMMAFTDFVTRSMRLHPYTYAARPAPPKSVHMTWISRRSSVIWPERRFCDNSSFFTCATFQHLGIRKLQRTISNEAAVVNELRALAARRHGPLNHSVTLTEVDFNIMTLKEQISVALMTDIMIGPHGAGLTHQMFMPDRSELIELFPGVSEANQHFHNMAEWRGRQRFLRYHSIVSDGNKVNSQEIGNLVRKRLALFNTSLY